MLNFQMTVIMDTENVPDNLKRYLPLYLELLLESPIMRNGGRAFLIVILTVQILNCFFVKNIIQFRASVLSFGHKSDRGRCHA